MPFRPHPTRLFQAALLAGLGAWAGGACRPLAPPEDVPGEDDGGGGPPPIEAGGTIDVTDVKVTSDPNNVLIATLTYTTNIAAVGTVTVTNLEDKTGVNVITLPAEVTPGTSHTATLMGMRASSSFQADINVSDNQGDTGESAAHFSTGPLPAGLPPVTVVISTPAMASPGYTLMTVWKWDGAPTASVDPSGSYVLAVDVAGEVVWYYKGIDMPGMYPVDAQMLANGDLAYITGDSGWAEVDMLGTLVATHPASAMGLDSLHDDLYSEMTGNFLGLSTQLKAVPGYPPGGGAPPDAGPVEGGVTLSVVGDVVAEFTPDGGVLNKWSTFSMLNPYVEGDFFDDPAFPDIYPDAGLPQDWTHSTSVRDDAIDGTYLLSSAAQSWILKFANDAGAPNVLWRLGPGGDFTLTTPNDSFQFNQNGVELLATGDILCFDNGNFRVEPDGTVPALFSRAVEFALDTPSMTATIAWQYQETPPFYSPFLGTATVLANMNVLVADGGEVENRISGDPADPTNLKFARIMEVTHDITPVKVLEVDINQAIGSIPGDPNFSGYSVSRARRILSLY